MSDFWRHCALGDVIAYGTTEKAEPQAIADDAWVLELEDIERDTSRLLTRVTFGERRSKSTKNRFRKGDVLYGKLRPYLNKVLVADANGYCSTEILPLRATPEVTAEYLYWWLKSPAFLDYVTAASHGMSMPRLGTEAGRQAPFVVPPIQAQREIAAKLQALAVRRRVAVTALDAVPPLLEKLRQSILAAAFRGDLTKDWRAKNKNVEPASVLLDRIRTERRKRWEESELQKMRAKGKPPSDDGWKASYKEGSVVDGTSLPALAPGWAWTSFDTVAQVDLGRQRAPQYQTGRFTRPYLRVANIKDDRLKLDDVLEMDFDERDFAHYALRTGDILLSEGQSPELVGQSAIYRGEVPGLCFQKTLHRFRAYPSGPVPEFSQLVFRHYLRNGTFRAIASLTTNIAHLTLVRLKPLHFPLPPQAEQVELTRLVASALARVEQLARAVLTARRDVGSLERSTLASAFRGSAAAATDAEAAFVESQSRTK